MKKVLVFSVGILLCAGAAFGQTGYIGLYTDYGSYSTCDYADVTTAVVTVYVVHLYNAGATASQWALEENGTFNCVYSGESSPMPVALGSSQTGISIAYGECLTSDTHILSVFYSCTGTSQDCAYLQVVPDPVAPTGQIEIVDCAYIKQTGVGGVFIINNDGSCGCERPTSETTWGQVKALYE